MNKVKSEKKYYVYGCDAFLEELRELIDSAASFEEQGKTAFEWLQAIDIADEYLLQDLSWGNAINTAIMYKTKKLLRIRKESIEDFPF